MNRSLVCLLLSCVIFYGCEENRPTRDAGTAADTGTVDVGVPDAIPDAVVPDSLIVPIETTIYAHSDDILFSFDADTNTVETIGTFRRPDSDMGAILDLAVNELGEIYVATRTGLYECDSTTAALTRIATYENDEGGFNALTFVPAGVIDPNNEVLVGVADTDIMRININDGSTSLVASYTDGHESSGDIVSVVNFGTYATVRDRDNGDGNDLLAELNPMTGQVRIVGSTGFRNIFGLGYWKGTLYGFTDAAELVQIDPFSGAGTLVSNATGAERFFGAGVTTVAPLI